MRWRRIPGWLDRFAEIGSLPSDSDELRLRKTVLTLSSVLMATPSFVWVITYAVLGLWVSAAIPFAYQLASAASIYTFARTRRYLLFRGSQLLMSLVLPCALLFVGAREAIPWFVAFVGLVAVSVGIDPALAAGAPDIPGGVVLAFFAL